MDCQPFENQPKKRCLQAQQHLFFGCIKSANHDSFLKFLNSSLSTIN
ncbi:hypothetical protein HMPREF0541_01627 [Lacticaseibacillus rhamnosus ATCC 21052]|nr:hypothetical protein HMPREF0541_01627 [Lacticaseibacillus rhamnosus ATCC 21052]